jgi:hypothetical protein
MHKFLEIERQRIASDREKLDSLVEREFQQEVNSLPRGLGGLDGRRPPGWPREPDSSKRPPPREPKDRERIEKD